MEPIETLGVVAHPGGVLVRRPELTVGVVRAVARPSGLAVELLSRTPREVAIRPAVAPRRLLPAYDEGMNLRVGWLEPDGRARWEYVTTERGRSSPTGPTERCGVYLLPPLFDEVSLVLAWPEIGFAETVLPLRLPARDEVEAAATSVWDAPRLGVPVTEEFDRHVSDFGPLDLAIEEGVVLAGPTVLHGSADAVVVLTRATAVGTALSVELLSIARGALAAVFDQGFPPPRDEFLCRQAAIAEVRGRDAHQLRSMAATFSGGGGSGGFGGGGGGHGGGGGDDGGFGDRHLASAEYSLRLPDGGVLDLVVSWSAVGLDEVRVRVPLNG
ncbi:hypothetical protein ACFFQW_34895 [Umezawaea endophytica]|uniref:Uncharacterized protein n=1 Tax=Umezawaea endophytica TaxID=1654476 RepID=A0A9X2VTD1_9PSEU|nr:hypothetical protein [Umezawaea endophytica]MCS7481852.1 hypothetical protein [Umezawaea endophytica]